MKGKRNRAETYLFILPMAAAMIISAALTVLPSSGERAVEGSQAWEIYSFDKPVLRLHVIANSDAPHDQSIKEEVALQVKQALEAPLGRLPGAGNWAAVEEALPKLADQLELYLEQRGAAQEITAVLIHEKFPLRAYGRKIYPPGEYAAVKVIIGEGKGENWWCLLFPSLCFPLAESIEVQSGRRQAQSAEISRPSGRHTRTRWLFKLKERIERWAARHP